MTNLPFLLCTRTLRAIALAAAAQERRVGALPDYGLSGIHCHPYVRARRRAVPT